MVHKVAEPKATQLVRGAQVDGRASFLCSALLGAGLQEVNVCPGHRSLRPFLQEDPAGPEASSCWEQAGPWEGGTAHSGLASAGQSWGWGLSQAWAHSDPDGKRAFPRPYRLLPGALS